jgi:hypothetical protein
MWFWVVLFNWLRRLDFGLTIFYNTILLLFTFITIREVTKK